MVLLANSPSMCASSCGLRRGYATLHALLQGRVRRWASVASLWSPEATWSASAGGDGGGAAFSYPLAATAAAAPDPFQLCMQYEAPVLVFLGG